MFAKATLLIAISFLFSSCQAMLNLHQRHILSQARINLIDTTIRAFKDLANEKNRQVILQSGNKLSMRQRPLDAESFIEKTLENTIADMFRNAFWLKSSADLFNTSDEYQLLSSLFAKYNDLKQQIMQIGNYHHEFTANFKIGEKCSKQITDLLTNDNIDRNDLLNMRFFCEIAAILHSLDRNKDFLIVATEMRGDANGKVNVVATGFRSFGDVVNDLGKSASNVRKDAYMQIELNDYREMVDELKAFVISNKKSALGNSVEQHFHNKQIVFSLIADFAKEFIEKFDFEGI